LKLLVTLMVLVCIAFVAVAVLRLRRQKSSDAEAWPFYKKRALSNPEQVLYHRLVGALPEHIVLAQVQVSRVLGVKQNANRQQWNNRINRMSFDFLVCAKDATPLAAIELDDGSHDSARARERDQRKERACSAAGLQLLRWNVKSLPDAASIRLAFSAQVPPQRHALDRGVEANTKRAAASVPASADASNAADTRSPKDSSSGFELSLS